MDDKNVQQMATLFFKNSDGLDYLAAVQLQERLVSFKRQESLRTYSCSLNIPMYTLWVAAATRPTCWRRQEMPVHRTSRGGDVTYHGPGQLVVYPIIDLRSKLRKDVHRYVRNLEQSAIQTLADFGIATTRRPPYTGIWIDDRKIAAIGVAVRRAITYHGLALNVNTDLAYFSASFHAAWLGLK